MLGLLLAYVAAAVPVVLWAVRHARAVPDGDPDQAAAGLRRAVRLQWAAEVGVRQLEQPRPLRLRWRSTVRPVAVTGSGSDGAGPTLAGELVQDPADPRSTAVALVEAFAGQAERQLVILGEPGAGKTTLVVLYVLAAIDAAAPEDPVPVLFSVAGWDPQERIEDWVARRLADDYPQVAGRGDIGWRLVQDQRVLPVLDGLDEMPQGLLGRALQDLDRAGGSGMRMLVTCRSAEFEAAVAEVGALSRAAVVEIEPVPADDVAIYLAQREVAGTQRWAPVVQEMRRHPDGPLATALSTPLMISLARRVYQAPDTSPRELAELPDAVQRHLLERFLPTVYPTPRAAARAERQLSFLAHHLRERVRNPNLEWWHLAQAVPRLVITTLVAGTLTCLGGLYGLATGSILIFTEQITPDERWLATVTGTIVGCSLGVLAGLHAGRTAHPPRRLSSRSVSGVVRGVLSDLGAVGAVLCVALAAAALLLLTTYVVAPPTAGAFAIELRTTAADPRWWMSAALVAVLATGIATMTNALGAGRTSAPRRSVPRGRDALPSLAVGLGVGLLFGLPLTSFLWFFGLSGFVVLGIGLTITAVISVTVGVGRWFAAPAVEDTAGSPETVLRSDRTALLFAAGAVGVCSFIASFAIFAIFWQLGEGTWAVGLIVGAMVGSATAVLVLFGSGAPWLSYTVARLWLALRSNLPWRLTHFLRHARSTGVLRQAGPAYQIRHDLLSSYLADRYRPTFRRHTAAATERRTTPLRRWRWRTASAVLALLLLPATVTLAQPDTLPRMTLPFTDLGQGTELAFRTDGRALTAVSFGAEEYSTVSGGITTSILGQWFWGLTQWRLPGGARLGQVARQANASNFDGAVSSTGTLVTAQSTDSSSVNGETDQLLVHNLDDRSRVLCGRGWADRCSAHKACGSDVSSQVGNVAISADGRSVVTGSYLGSLRLWPVVTDGDPVTITCGGASSMGSIAVSPDGTKVAAIVADDNARMWSVRMWDVATGAARTLRGSVRYPIGLVFSANGDVLAATSDDRVLMWRVADGAPLPSIAAAGLNGLAITPDGATVAAYDWYGLLRLWDVATGRHTATLPYRATIIAAAFSPDGKTLATAGTDAVRLWSVPELVAAQN